jgi:hypothetical protein
VTFLASLEGHIVLNTDPVFRLDGARPDNTFTPPSLTEIVPVLPCSGTTLKNAVAYIKISSEYCQFIYWNDKQFGNNTIK